MHGSLEDHYYRRPLLLSCYVGAYETSSSYINESFYNMRCLAMFITAVCFYSKDGFSESVTTKTLRGRALAPLIVKRVSIMKHDRSAMN